MDKYHLIKATYLVSHRCHERVSALRFAKCRKWYVKNLRITAKKYSVTIINYLISKDGVYLLCVVDDPQKLSTMMQILQSSASKNFASKRGGESSMWRGRFNATIVHGDIWIRQCMLLLDLHMVATEQIVHPAEWKDCGWHEIAGIKQRCKVISAVHALETLGHNGNDQDARAEYLRAIEDCCQKNRFGCLETWTNALAVGSSDWIESVSESIPNAFKSINTLHSSASPFRDGNDKTVALTISKKRRRGYLNIISRKMGCNIKRVC